METLHLRCLRVVDVDVVAEQEQGPRIDLTDGVPHPLVRRHVARPSAERDRESVAGAILLQGGVGKGSLPWPGLRVEPPGSRFSPGHLQQHPGVPGVDALALCRFEVGDRFLLFPL